MSFLLTLVPLPWRVAALAAFAAALWGHGWWTGRSGVEHTMDVKDAKIQVLTDQAIAKAAKTKKDQEENTRKVREDHDAEVNEIHSYYAANPDVRVRTVVRTTNCPAGSPVTRGAGGADAGATESVATRRDSGFEKACALDAAQVNALRAFLTRNGFPIR